MMRDFNRSTHRRTPDHRNSHTQSTQAQTEPSRISQPPPEEWTVISTNDRVNPFHLFTTSQRLEIAQTEWKRLFNVRAENDDTTPVNRPRATLQQNIPARINNIPWGDELGEKAEGQLRLYAGNVNGFTLDSLGGQFDTFCRILKEVQADFVCGQESNIDTTKSQVRSILFHTAKQHWQRNKLDFATTPQPFYTMYKPGGTFVMSMGNITGRAKERHRDKWGRWSSQIVHGKENQSLIVISAYQVTTDYPTAGTITAASQQHLSSEVYLPKMAIRLPSQGKLFRET